jgi:hypothetical protein
MPQFAVVDDEPLSGAEQLVGDDQRTDRVIAGPAAGITDDVRVAFAQACVLGGVEHGVHAGEDGEASCRWQGESALRAERRRVLVVCLQDFVENSRSNSPV